MADMLETSPELQLLDKLCTPKEDARKPSPTLRPERRPEPPMFTVDSGRTPYERWNTVLGQIRSTLCTNETPSVQAFIDTFKARYWGSVEDILVPILQVVAAILYDIDSSGTDIWRRTEATPQKIDVPWDHIGQLSNNLSPLFEQMLLVDYGLGERAIRGPPVTPSLLFYQLLWPAVPAFCQCVTEFAFSFRRGEMPDWKVWDYMVWRVPLLWQEHSADMGVMVYYYHTNRRVLESGELRKGITGYTSVLPGMRAEYSRHGAGRLARKLSVDVNLIIPRAVRKQEDRERMNAIIESLASRYGVILYAPGRSVPAGDGVNKVGKDWVSYVFDTVSWPFRTLAPAGWIPNTPKDKDKKE